MFFSAPVAGNKCIAILKVVKNLAQHLTQTNTDLFVSLAIVAYVDMQVRAGCR